MQLALSGNIIGIWMRRAREEPVLFMTTIVQFAHQLTFGETWEYKCLPLSRIFTWDNWSIELMDEFL